VWAWREPRKRAGYAEFTQISAEGKQAESFITPKRPMAGERTADDHDDLQRSGMSNRGERGLSACVARISHRHGRVISSAARVGRLSYKASRV
jgi:hypothetical protein